MAKLLDGPRTWSLSIDDDDYRTYKVRYLVKMDSPLEGPAQAIGAPGLPVVGNPYVVDADVDFWCYCRRPLTVNPLVSNEPNLYFELEYQFSNKPDLDYCKIQQRTNPLQVPDRILGNFSRYQEEAAYDLDGKAIVNSAFEQYRGPQVEFDHNRIGIKIEQNTAQLQLSVIGNMIDCVNDAPLWGFDTRCVKLSNCSWERKFDGFCSIYFTRTLDFEVAIDNETPAITSGSGWDRVLQDEGTKALNGDWARNRFDVPTGEWVLLYINGRPPDPTNPAHFIRFKDYNGENQRIVLDGAGKPAGANVPSGSGGASSPGFRFVQYYPVANFLLLGIPTDLAGVT